MLNTLVAVLNLSIKKADKNVTNLYHLQMASLQVEVELGLLSSAERARRDWFPDWFSYSMTEAEKRAWNEYVEKDLLIWTKENDSGEDKDHALAAPVREGLEVPDEAQLPAPNVAAPASFAPSTEEKTEESTLQSKHGATANEQSNTKHAEPSETTHTAESSKRSAMSLQDAGLLDDGHNDAESVDDNQTNTQDQKQTPAPVTGSLVSDTTRLCSICEAPGRLCHGCQNVAYCGPEHQRADWKSHKRACKGKDKA